MPVVMDPRAPLHPPRQHAATTRTALEQFTQRMLDLGATDEECALVAAHWDELDDDFTPEARAEMLTWPDRQLWDAIQATRDEWAEMHAATP